MKVLMQYPQLLKGFKNRKTTIIVNYSTIAKCAKIHIISISVILYFNTNNFMIFPSRMRFNEI